MKNFLASSPTAIESVIEGILAQSRVALDRVDGHLAVVHRGNPNRSVRIVTGGGSGHEPLFLGTAGPGMADAAVAGQVFTAPNPFSVRAAAEACGVGKGIIYIYGNYSGDVFNFHFAAEEAKNEGWRVAEIRVHDDVASSPVDQLTARRGIAGDIFVIKCAAAAADFGLSFDEVLRIGEKVNYRTRSIGVAFHAASSIHTGEPMFDLPAGLMEVGMGLHGEMGVLRTEFAPAEKLVPQMLEMILEDFKATGSPADRVAVMINGLGGTTVLELLVVAGHVSAGLKAADVATGLFVTGEFATSLDMAGFSITLLHLDDEIEPLLAAPCESFCFSQSAVSD